MENAITISFQQFKNIIEAVSGSNPLAFRVIVDKYTINLASKNLRVVLQLPDATDNKSKGYKIDPTPEQMVKFFHGIGQAMHPKCHIKRVRDHHILVKGIMEMKLTMGLEDEFIGNPEGIDEESRFRRFLDNKLEEGDRMWHSIEKGPYDRPMIPNPGKPTKQILELLSKMTEGNKKQYIADVRVMNYILQAIPNDIYN
ncbi:hypothetical protein Tco_1222718 [Tanacetum coccineum]